MFSVWLIFFFILFILQKQVIKVEGKKGFGPGEQDWDHVEVRPGAFMFWWLFYANPPTNSSDFSPLNKPLLIWLQGGPGTSSTGIGNFKEFGPLDINLQERNYTGVNDYNILFVDNPVGTGFSYITNDSLYVKNNDEIASDLLKSISEFLNKHHEFGIVPTYIYGECYGAKMATVFALAWDKAQKSGEIKSNLKGIALDDPWISPADAVHSYAPYLYYTGMINSDGYETVKTSGESIINLINQKNWTAATNLLMETWGIIFDLTNNIDVFNILHKEMPDPDIPSYTYFSDNRKSWNDSNPVDVITAIMNDKVKGALGLNVSHTVESYDVSDALVEDIMKPVTNIVERILNETNLKVFVFNGDLDALIPIVSTFAWIEKLNWQGTEMWKTSKRISFCIDNIVEGYVQEYGNLKMYWVDRSGHQVAQDNPYALSIVLRLLTSS